MLHGSHFIDDALEDALDGFGRQRPGVMAQHVRKYLVLALGFVHREMKLLFDAADLFDDRSALVEQLQELQVELIDAVAATREVGRREAVHAERRGAVNCRVKFCKRRARSGAAALFSMNRTRALPTTTPSARAATSATCCGRAYAEADGKRQSGELAHPRDERLDRFRNFLLFAGDAGPRDEIDEAGRVLGNQFEAALAAGGGGEKDRIETEAAECADGLGCFFDGKIGEQHAIDTGFGGILRQLFKAVAKQWIEIAEEQQRDLGRPADLADDFKEPGQVCAGAEGTIGGALNDGAIGNGIGEGHSEFDQIGAALLKSGNEGGGLAGRGVASGEVSNEGFAAVLTAVLKEVCDTGCEWQPA